MVSDADKRKYRSSVSTIMYLGTMTRADFCHIASIPGSHLEKPSERQCMGANRALPYLQGTRKTMLVLRPEASNQSHSYADSTWGTEPNMNRQGRTGILFRYGSAPVYVISKLQSTARSVQLKLSI